MKSIDEVLGRQAIRKGERLDPSYNPAQAVLESSLLHRDTPNLTVVFPPWHNGGKVFDRLTRRLGRQSAVLSYKLHPQVIEPDADRVLASFMRVQEAIAEDINAAAPHYDEVTLMGLSLGTVSLSLAARVYPKFSSAKVVVGSGSLAASFWDGQRTQGIKNLMEADGMTRGELLDKWGALTTDPDNFTGKPVKVVVSSTDTIVPTSHQKDLVSSLAQANAVIDTRHTTAGHYAAATLFCVGALQS